MDLKAYYRPLLKWWWLLLLATLIATVSSFLAVRRVAPMYSARVRLMVGQSLQSSDPVSSDVQLSVQLAQTYVELAKGAEVARKTAAATGLASLPQFTVSQVPNTQLLDVRVLDTDPRRAQLVANALADQLVDLSPAESPSKLASREFLSSQLIEIQKVVDDTDAKLAELNDQMANMYSARQIADANQQLSALASKRDAYLQMYVEVIRMMEGGANQLRVVERADLPATPVPQRGVATVLLAAVIGFGLAAAGAYLIEYLDDTLKIPDDVTRATGLSTLGAITRFGNGEPDKLLPVIAPSSPEAEQFRVLRTNIQFSSLDAAPRTLAVTSSSPREGKSTMAANLAVALAQQGQTVILVDADLRRPSIHRLFGLPNQVGLSNLLLAPEPAVGDFLKESWLGGLRLLTSGSLPPDPASLLASQRFSALLNTLQGYADIVIFDCPPVLGLADAALLGRLVDGVLFVIDAGVTRRQWATAALDSLRKVNAKVLGVVLNRFSDRRSSYYTYGSYYYYYASDGTPRRASKQRSRLGRRGADPA